jgi:hypothetical protein
VDERTRARWVMIPWMLASIAVALTGQALHNGTVVGLGLVLISLWILAGAWFGKPQALPEGRRWTLFNRLPDPWWRLLLFAGGLFMLAIALAGLAAQ